MSMNTQMHDDQYTYDPNNYVEPGAEQTPYPGFYRITPLSVGRAKNREGEEILRDGWPILRVNRVQAEDAEGNVQKFAVFQDIPTKPMNRKGPGGRPVAASVAADVLRAVDKDLAAEVGSFEEVYETLEEQLAASTPFVAYVGLTARDSGWIKQQLEAAGPDASAETRNKIYSEGTKYTKDFRNPDGTFRFTVLGPSGTLLTAKPTLSRYVSSDKALETELGPQKATAK